MTRRLPTILGASILAAASAACAGAAPAEDGPDTDFPQGTWTFQLYSGYLNDLGSQDTEGGFLSTGVSYYLWDNVSLGAEVTGYGIGQPGDDAAAGAAGIVLRHHLVNAGPSSFFVDVAFAPFEATDRVPEGGTRFNFVTQTGVGVAHEVSGGWNLLLGVRFIHVSNAGIETQDRNPSVNGISAYAGVMFRF